MGKVPPFPGRLARRPHSGPSTHTQVSRGRSIVVPRELALHFPPLCRLVFSPLSTSGAFSHPSTALFALLLPLFRTDHDDSNNIGIDSHHDLGHDLQTQQLLNDVTTQRISFSRFSNPSFRYQATFPSNFSGADLPALSSKHRFHCPVPHHHKQSKHSTLFASPDARIARSRHFPATSFGQLSVSEIMVPPSLELTKAAVPLTCHGHSRPVTHLSFSGFVGDEEYYMISACKGVCCAGRLLRLDLADSVR